MVEVEPTNLKESIPEAPQQENSKQPVSILNITDEVADTLVSQKSLKKNTLPVKLGILSKIQTMDIKEAKKIIGNKIIGITCHNSIKIAKEAIKNRANYIAFGAFFPTKTKKAKYRATIKTLNKVKKLTNIPIVAIGGITNENYKKLLLNNANFLAISGYIWNNKKYKPKEAIESLI